MQLAKYVTLYALLSYAQHAAALDAPAALIPSDLNPGDQFYIVFAGSDVVNGAQTSATYTAYAAAVKANDPDTDAISGWTTLFGHDDSSLVTLSAFGAGTSYPIYNTNGDRVANNTAGLFSDSLNNPIGYDESGTAVNSSIWTGFNFTGSSTGIGDDSLGGNDSLSDGCLAGSSNQVNNQWAASILAGGNGCAGASYGLYVVSPLLSVPAPVVSISPDTIDFGIVGASETSNEYTVTLSNSGTADWEISSIDAAVAPFVASGGTCGSAPLILAVGSSCTLSFTVSPGGSSFVSQTVLINSNAPSSPDAITLKRRVIVPVPALNLNMLVLLITMLAAVVGLHMRRAE